jgi:anti-sigma factor RsiW
VPVNTGGRERFLSILRRDLDANEYVLSGGLLNSDHKARRPRLALRRGDDAGVAAELLTILLTITADGRIADEEAEQLSRWLAENKAATNLAGFHYLTGILTHALSDGILTSDERREIYKAIEKVLPADARREAKERRGAAEVSERLQARAEKEAHRQRRKANSPVKSLNFLVAGVGYEGRKRVVEEYANIGDAVYLVRDPQNKYDRNAIELRLANNQQVGYVPAEIAAQSASLMDAGFLQRAYITKFYAGKRHTIPVVQAYLYRPEATVKDALSPEALRGILESRQTGGVLRTEETERSAASSRLGCGCLTAAFFIGVTIVLLSALL